MGKFKSIVGELTDILLSIAALAVVASIVAGNKVPFLGNVVDGIIGIVDKLSQAGLVGLIALGIILWLFSNRKAP